MEIHHHMAQLYRVMIQTGHYQLSVITPLLISRRFKMGRSANDDRSDSMNPNNDAYDDSMDNHSNQLNPNNEEYQGDENNE